MARWRLLKEHYLPIVDTFWEYVETPMGSRRQLRKKFPVPRYLHPEDSLDCNYNPGGTPRTKVEGDRGDPGWVVVAYPEGSLPDDHIMKDDTPPTLDMEPLDDEAKAISAEWSKTWGKQWVDDADGYGKQLVIELSETLGALKQQQATAGVPVELAATLKAQSDQIAQLTAMCTALISHLETPRAASARR